MFGRHYTDKEMNDLLKSLSTTAVTVGQAERGDRLAAKELLIKASKLLIIGEPIPKELASWLGKALGNIAEGEDPKSALNLKKPRGKPEKYTDEFQQLVAGSIHSSEAGLHKGENKDETKLGAYAQAAEDFGISANTAEKFYKKHIDIILQEEEIRQEFQKENN
jgi:hypothetical protein